MTRALRSWKRSASPLPGQSTISVEMPRAAISFGHSEVYMCSLVESRPFHMIMVGAGVPSARSALVKYDGSVPSSNGTSTRDVAGSMSSNDLGIRSRPCW